MTNEEMIEHLKEYIDAGTHPDDVLKLEDIITHLHQPANNAELVEILEKAIFHSFDGRNVAVPLEFVKQAQAALSAAPEVEELKRLSRIAEIIDSVDNLCMAADGPVSATLDEMRQSEISEIYSLAIDDPSFLKPDKNTAIITTQVEQPANPSALADEIENKLSEPCTFTPASVEKLLKQVVPILRKFDVLQCLRDGNPMLIQSKTHYIWDGFFIKYYDPIDPKSLYTADGTDYMNILGALMRGDLQPYTTPEVLELENMCWYWIEHKNYNGFIPAKYKSEENTLTYHNFDREIDDRVTIVTNPDTGKPWKIEQPKGGA